MKLACYFSADHDLARRVAETLMVLDECTVAVVFPTLAALEERLWRRDGGELRCLVAVSGHGELKQLLDFAGLLLGLPLILVLPDGASRPWWPTSTSCGLACSPTPTSAIARK